MITLKNSKTWGFDGPYDDVLVLTLDVYGWEVSRILIDNRSSVDIIFSKSLRRKQIKESEADESSIELTGIDGKTTIVKGSIKLQVIATGISKFFDFFVLDYLSTFNMILGRPRIHSMKAIPSTYH